MSHHCLQTHARPLPLVATGLLATMLAAGCRNQSTPPPVSSTGRATRVASSPMQTRIKAFLPWGSDPNRVARFVPKEGAPEGPMSFDRDARGRLALLDQVNQRVLFLDRAGSPEGFVPLPGPTFQDLRLVGDGAVAVMDRLKQREILVLSRSGQVLGKTPLEGPFVPEGGGVTALLAQPDGLWVEVEHRYSVLVADLRGRPLAERIRRRGRVLGDMRARLWRNSPTQVTLATAPLTSSGRESKMTLTYPEPIRLTGLVRLDNGGFALSAQSISRPARSAPMDRVYVDFVDATGLKWTGRWTGSVPAMAEETFQVLRTGPGGGVTILHLEEQGVVVQEVRP